MTVLLGVTGFKSFGGDDIWINVGAKHVILRIPTTEELERLVVEFRRRQLAWLQHYMASPVDNGRLYGTQVSAVPRPNGGVNVVTPRFAFEAVPPAAWQALAEVPTPPNSPPSAKLLNASVEHQREFLRICLGSTFESAQNFLRAEYVSALVCPWLEESFRKLSSDPKRFLESVIARSEYERNRVQDKGRKRFLRSSIPDMFLVWMAQHNIVLFPIRPTPITGERRGDLLDRMTCDDVKNTWSIIETAHADSFQRHPRTVEFRAKNAFETLTLCSTLRRPEDSSDELFECLFLMMNKTFEVNVPNMLHRLYRPLRDVLGRRDLPIFKPRRSSKSEKRNPFAWTRLSTDKHPRIMFPLALVGEYQPDERIAAWGDRLNLLLPKIQNKSIGNTISTAQRLLVWLANSKYPLFSVADLKRSHINDGKSLEKSDCLRASLWRDGNKVSTVNNQIQRICSFFQTIIDEDRLAVANPIVLKLDSFVDKTVRGKTPRRPMGRGLLAYLKELNRKEDFAVSRGMESHYCDLRSDEGKYVPVWFPGVSALVDLLLQLPLRGFQARFLDSGEGDEEIVRSGGEKFEMVKNPLASAMVNRRESVFYLFGTKDGESSLGIHVNTNKTSVDRLSGYEIAWCPPDLYASLSALLEWQIANNPVVKAIPCIEKGELEKTQNPDVLLALKTSFPLFRDPSDPQGWPISPLKLFDFWSKLLAEAEDALAANGKRVKLTEWKEVSKGPGKKPEKKRVALYDIHTLRVSGISALIEAGVPPDLVQEIAGHATLVMTLYYNKIRASRLNKTLSTLLNKMSGDLDSIDGMSVEEYEKLAQWLINNRSNEDACGASLLQQRRGGGDGVVEVFVHGICPAGDCDTGGEYVSAAVGFGPVPRPGACSLCRYRLTGPMFLAGLVLNANKLMYELRTKGKEIAEQNALAEQLTDAGKPLHAVKARIEELYRDTDVVAREWAAEVQYVYAAEQLFASYMQSVGEDGDTGELLPTLMNNEEPGALMTRLSKKSEFTLLQNLADGAQEWSGFRPTAALTDHREFLNEVLAASGAEPFLLRLRGDARDRAAAQLGRIVTSLVPDERHEALRNGEEKLENYPDAAALLAELRAQIGQVSSTRKVIPIAVVTAVNSEEK